MIVAKLSLMSVGDARAPKNLTLVEFASLLVQKVASVSCEKDPALLLPALCLVWGHVRRVYSGIPTQAIRHSRSSIGKQVRVQSGSSAGGGAAFEVELVVVLSAELYPTEIYYR